MTCLQSLKLFEVFFSNVFLSSEFDWSRVSGSDHVSIHRKPRGSRLALIASKTTMEEDESSDSSTSNSKKCKPRKITCLYWNSCVCHCCDVNGALTSFTAVSWARLHEVACVRKVARWSFVKGQWNEGPHGFYHRECYKAYTRPSSLRQ